MPEYDDFQEIGHCGGRATFDIQCDDQGNKAYSLGFSHDRPGPASWIGIYALADGSPVSDFRIGGIGQGFDPQPQAGWFPVFLGSDSRSCWGHQCPRCASYFRNRSHPAIYPLTCPYCGLRVPAFRFLTPAQKAYARHYLDTLLNALDEEMERGTGRQIIIDMDAIADQSGDQAKPNFYYTAETQQTRYNCEHCGEFNDIRGRYGYCASCAWRNNAQSLRSSFATLRQKMNAGQLSAVETVKSAVSDFDASCRDMAVQIRGRIPMKLAKRAALDRLMFHDIDSPVIAMMKSMFDIDLLRGLDADIGFVRMMMHRRHVYEHNAGVADERYVRESGDQSARIGVLIRESRENAHRLVSALARMIYNFDSDFHEIFQPTEWPIRNSHARQARQNIAQELSRNA